jgi:hypothetical protein
VSGVGEWWEWRASGPVRGCPVGMKLGVGCQHVGPTWKREEACEPHMEVMGQPRKKGNGPAQETVVLFIY